MNVSLRRKPIAGGMLSLYLDFYPPIINPETGKPTRRQFLGLYVHDEKALKILRKRITPLDKKQDKETETLAENIRSQRQVEISKESFGFLIKETTQESFFEFFKSFVEQRKIENHSLRVNYKNMFNHFEQFCKGKCSFGEVTKERIEKFRSYLKTAKSHNMKVERKRIISNSTSAHYFTLFKAVVIEAYKKKKILDNPCRDVAGIKVNTIHRQYLTLDELKSLVITDCYMPELKRASLFSALTGLRYSDIHKLTWKEVVNVEGEGHYVRFTQKKTKEAEMMPIGEQAVKFLGERGGNSEKVFKTLHYTSFLNEKLQDWVTKAGIDKHITFHCFRHTYAILQLAGGTDIYTVSNMLGHTDLKTTKIYAKILNPEKRKAADRIQLGL
jgi:integrase